LAELRRINLPEAAVRRRTKRGYWRGVALRTDLSTHATDSRINSSRSRDPPPPCPLLAGAVTFKVAMAVPVCW
jgi:hypothetical protein